MKKWIALAALCALPLAMMPSAHAQQALGSTTEEIASLKKEIESLKLQLATMQRDLLTLRTLLTQNTSLRTGPTNTVPTTDPAMGTSLSVAGLATKGSKTAKIALVEFTDYQCPFCGRHVRDTYPQLQKEYIQTGKVQYFLKDFPLNSHVFAKKASEAAYCAEDQGKYWEMHDKLFENQQALQLTNLITYAQQVGLDVPKFQACMDSGKHAARVQKNYSEGQAAGVRSVPSFYIGRIEPNGTVRVLQVIQGAKPYASFKEALDTVLAAASAGTNGVAARNG
jgi:protein-disulfide isomerase